MGKRGGLWVGKGGRDKGGIKGRDRERRWGYG